ncbi:MAG: hypothetical protein NTY50_01090 [Methylobacter sp.]|nr:hypothetical protein [Methylobacter sp.]
MAEKNEIPTATKAKSDTKTAPEKAIPVNEAPVHDEENAAKAQDSATGQSTSIEQENSPNSGRGRTDTLSPELMELVMELRDTVKRINPKNHTAKTLRRSLSNVSDILKDIDKLYPEN